jgi:alpha-L-fucosidase
MKKPSLPKTIPTPGDTTWFTHERFGMFIHWGTYAAAARHEWVKNYEKIQDDKYQDYFDHFNPDLFDPVKWARAAWDAGMRYFVITTKHHEGFCLWDTQHTDYKAPNSPYGKDLLREAVEAFRNQGFRVGFYYSLIDWHHPDFTIDYIHPRRDDPLSAIAQANRKRNMKRYAAYMRDQVRELLTGFGQIDIMWFDFSYPHSNPAYPHHKGKGRKDWESEKLYALVRELQPNIILDDRMDLPTGWDIKTPEQYQPHEWVRHNGKHVVWEACQTLSGSWGYHRDETTWKSEHQLIAMLVDTVSKGGNLLMNVGPTARGELDHRAINALAQYGEWMKRHERSIRGCTQAPQEWETPCDCRLTYNPETHRAYLHIFAWPFVNIHMPGWAGRIRYAQLLNDASEIRFEDLKSETGTLSWNTHGQPGSTILQLPVVKPNAAVPVIELFLK